LSECSRLHLITSVFFSQVIFLNEKAAGCFSFWFCQFQSACYYSWSTTF
jgi:hypothetical protein